MKKSVQKRIHFFLEYLQIEKNYSQYTVDFYKEDIEHFSLFMNEQGIESFQHVEYFDARLYVTALYEKKYARASVARKISSLRSFYKFLLKESVVEENPFAFVMQPKQGVRLPTFFYEEEMERLFTACEVHTPLGIRNRAIIELLYATGIRVGECVQIKLSDLDFELSTVLVKGKGKRERYVPFGSYALQALNSYIHHARNTLIQTNSPHPYVFVNARGGALTERGVRYILTNIMKKAALDGNISPHKIRHSFATHLLNNGADMRTVQELLGHVHLSSTQVYTHVTKEHLQSTYMNHHPRA